MAKFLKSDSGHLWPVKATADEFDDMGIQVRLANEHVEAAQIGGGGDVLVTGCEDNPCRSPTLVDDTCNIQPIPWSRQVDVNEQEINADCVKHRQCLFRRTGLQDLEALGSKFIADEAAGQYIIFDDENGWRRSAWKSRD
jgi:hypothetical protein